MANEVNIKIQADGSIAINGINQVNGAMQQIGKNSESTIDRMKRGWLGVGAGVMAVYYAFQKIYGLMEQAAQIDEAMSTLNALTRQYGMSAEDLVGKIEAVSHGIIGMKDAAGVANDALIKGFTPEQIVQMASWARTLSHATAGTQTAAESFRQLEGSMTAARERGAVKLLGATIDLNAKYGEYAATMSKAEKAQAIFTMAGERMAQVQATLGDQADSAADRMERFNKSIERAKYSLGEILLLIGQPMMAVFNVVMTLAFGVAGAIATVISHFARLTDLLKITEGEAANWEKRADKMFSNSAKNAADALVNIKGAISTVLDMGGTVGLGGDDDNLKKQEKLDEAYRALLKERDLLNAASIDKERVQADAWYAEQVEKLKQIGATEREYGAARELYRLKLGKAEMDRATQIADFYIAEQKRISEETEKIEQARVNAFYRMQIDSVKVRQEGELSAASVLGVDPVTLINMRTDGELEILSIREKSLIATMTENTTFEENLKIGEQIRDVWNQMDNARKKSAADLAAERLKSDAPAQIAVWNNGVGKQKQVLDDATASVNLYKQAWMYVNQSAQSHWTAVQQVGLQAFNRMGDAISQFVMTGKASFRDFANSVISDLMRIAIQASIVQPIAKAFFPSMFPASIPGRAYGGDVYSGTPYWVGERGPELFVPSSAGSIVTNTSIRNGGNVTVNVVNNSGQPVSAKQTGASFDGQRMIVNLVIDAVNRNVGGLRTVLGGT